MFGFAGRGGRGGPGGPAATRAASRRQAPVPRQENREPTAVEKAAETLNTTLENQSASAEQIKTAAHRLAGGPREGHSRNWPPPSRISGRFSLCGRKPCWFSVEC